MLKRSEIIAAIRGFFLSRGFLEAETPVVVPVPGTEPHLDPFAATVATQEGRKLIVALRTSPEYALKKLLAGGIGQVFEIAKVFRNGEPWGGTHNPEFTMIEWYRSGADYRQMMRDTEEMVADVATRTTGKPVISYGGRVADLTPPWPVMTVAEAMERYAGLDLGRAIGDPEWFRQAVTAKGCTLTIDDTFDDVFFKIFLRDVEPRLSEPAADGRTIRPVFLCDYPRSMAALARLKKEDNRYAERFEAYCAGMELCNAYSELNDAIEQRRRVEDDNAFRARLGKPVYGTDEQFLEAVGSMPDSAGIAFGVDRLVMLLTDARDIEDVLFFPAKDLFG